MSGETISTEDVIKKYILEALETHPDGRKRLLNSEAMSVAMEEVLEERALHVHRGCEGDEELVRSVGFELLYGEDVRRTLGSEKGKTSLQQVTEAEALFPRTWITKSIATRVAASLRGRLARGDIEALHELVRLGVTAGSVEGVFLLDVKTLLSVTEKIDATTLKRWHKEEEDLLLEEEEDSPFPGLITLALGREDKNTPLWLSRQR